MTLPAAQLFFFFVVAAVAAFVLFPFAERTEQLSSCDDFLKKIFFGTFRAIFDLLHLSCVAIQIIVAKNSNLLGDVLHSRSVNHHTF